MGGDGQARTPGRGVLAWSALLLGAALWLLPVSRMRFFGDDFSILRTIEATFPTWRDDFRVLDNGFWRPGMLLFFRACRAIVGMSPPLFHYATWVVHVLCAAALWVLARRLGIGRRFAWLAPLVLLVHFASRNAVLWPTAVVDSGYTFFMLVGLWGYVRGIERRSPAHCWLASVVGLGGALFMKETGLVFVPILVLYELLVSDRSKGAGALKRAAVRLFPAGAIFLCYAIWMAWRITAARYNYIEVGVFRLLGWHVPRNLLDFAAAVFVPWPYHGPPPLLDVLATRGALLATRTLALVGLPALAFFWWRRGDRLSLWLLAWIVLVGVIPSFSLTTPTSRYYYGAVAGFAILFAHVASQLLGPSAGLGSRRSAKRAVVAAIVAYLVLMAASDLFSPSVRGFVRLSRQCEVMAEQLSERLRLDPQCKQVLLVDPPLAGPQFYQAAIAKVITLLYVPERDIWIGVLRREEVLPTVAGKVLPDYVRFFLWSDGHLHDVTDKVRQMAQTGTEVGL